MSMEKIQQELKAPKGNFNSFGKYKYRSCEDIVEAAKPVLFKHGCYLNLSDEMVMLGDRFYIKATAMVMQGKELLASSTAFARESLDKKGMDDSQITGTASSYARKYALNGLFAIDDTKDADTNEHKEQVDSAPAEKLYSDWVQENSKAVAAIKTGIANDDLQTAAAAWFTLPDDAKMALWKAPTKGGCFSTKEREVIRTPDFRAAHYGEKDSDF
jgi:hypothetical protein